MTPTLDLIENVSRWNSRWKILTLKRPGGDLLLLLMGSQPILAMLALAPWWNQVRQGRCICAKILSPPQPSKRKFQQRNNDSSTLPPEERSSVETHVMSHVSRWLSHHSQSRVIRLESQSYCGPAHLVLAPESPLPALP